MELIGDFTLKFAMDYSQPVCHNQHCKISLVNQTLCIIVKDKSVHCGKQIKSIQPVFILHNGPQQILTKDISLPFL